MKTQTIRSTWGFASSCFVGLALAAEPEPPSSESSAESPEVRANVAILAAPIEVHAGGENEVFFQTGHAAQQAMQETRDKLKDPAGRAALRMEQRAAFERLYADIDQELGLDANTKDKLMDVLADGQLAALESSFMMQPDHETARQKQADAETQKLASLRELLGQDGLEKLQSYLVSVAERDQVKRLDALLPATERLQAEQKSKLVQLFLEKNERAREQQIRLHLSVFPDAPMERLPTPDELQRRSQLLTIEGNEAALRRAQEENPLLESRAAEFLSPTQQAAFARMNQDEVTRLREWIEQARLRAGLLPQISAGSDELLITRAAPRKPIAGDATFEFSVTVNRNPPVTYAHTGPNAKPILFEAGDGLWIEATPTLYEDHWLDVHLAYYEQVGDRKRRIDKGSRFGTLTRSPEGASGGSGMSTDVVTGSKGYAVKTVIRVLAP